jgi:hypothetical protein
MILFIIVFCIFISIIYWTLKNGISPMPTSPKVKQALLGNLPVIASGTIFELGSGWGTLAFPLANQYPSCKIMAYENSPIPFLFSKIRHFICKKNNLEFENKNFFHADLQDAKMIICFLYPGAMNKLQTKLKQELCSGTWIISHTFALPGWLPEKVIEVQDLYHTKIYLYKV